MPTTRRTRTIAAPPDELWSTIADPYHLPRWWPRVDRVEVRWPNGLEEEWLDLAVDRIHTLKEGTGRPLGAKG